MNVEINKTNDLISKLVPFHILNVIKNEKRQVDEFEDVTILNAKVVGINKKGVNAFDPKEIIMIL